MAGQRLLIYSHDSFGLGHLRRCRAIARSMVTRSPDLHVQILSGQPLIERYDSHSRIQVKLLPEIRKLANGEYRPLASDVDIHEAIAQRSKLIRDAADQYRPDLVLIDKEPLGIRGELHEALELLKARGVPVILGVRDVMDAPDRLAAEWTRKQAFAALEKYYEEIWVYGVPELFDPLAGLDLSDAVRRRVFYTSYIRRPRPEAAAVVPEHPFLLVTAGGGGDGEELVDWVLSAREHHEREGRDDMLPLLIVSGPFMNGEAREAFERRAARLRDVQLTSFVAHMESLVVAASGVVAMCGYNTFCEILSFDKPAIFVPRTAPRLEQYIRASRAQEIGLATMLAAEGDVRDPARMASALMALPHKAPPSSVFIPWLLDGHEIIADRAARWLEGTPSKRHPTWLERSRSS